MIVNNYNNTYHSTIKMNPVDVNQAHILTLVKTLMMKILNLRFLILVEYQNMKTSMFQIALKKFSLLKMLKTLSRGHMLLAILKAKKSLEHFTKKNCKK